MVSAINDMNQLPSLRRHHARCLANGRPNVTQQRISSGRLGGIQLPVVNIEPDDCRHNLRQVVHPRHRIGLCNRALVGSAGATKTAAHAARVINPAAVPDFEALGILKAVVGPL